MERMERVPRAGGVQFRNVVVGVDGRQGGRDAVALAAKLAATDGLTTSVRVLMRDPLVGSPDSTRVIDHDQVRFIEAPSVGRGLHELAEAEGADLLVIGSCRRGLMGRVMIGDETSDALNGASCAVAVAPFGYADAPAVIDPIGVAYDGSDESAAALSVGRELAHQHDARLSAFPDRAAWRTQSRHWWTRLALASTRWATSSRTPPSAWPPRSWPSTAHRWAC
jgi:nucleotide-binding universal stress UspA family protein